MSWFESRRALEDADPFAEPWVEVKHGCRVVIETGDLIQVNVPYERYQHPDWFDGDVFQLDSAGLYRYRPVEDERRWPALRDGFTAYERVQ